MHKLKRWKTHDLNTVTLPRKIAEGGINSLVLGDLEEGLVRGEWVSCPRLSFAMRLSQAQ